MSSNPTVRVATSSDVPAIIETISLAFHDDPTWAWAFPDRRSRQAQFRIWWGLHANGAMRFEQPAVYVTDAVEAAALWIPPGEPELSDEQTARVAPMLAEMLGEHSDVVFELLERFEAVQPENPPHYYLSLLGVHDGHRGRGLGMKLLAENLERFDAEGIPSYLESSNSANDSRYERLGYARIGEFTTPDDRVAIGAFWRDASG